MESFLMLSAEMLKVSGAIGIIVLIIIFWLFVNGMVVLGISGFARKKYKKNLRIYPYFSYSFYKKTFMLGLKGIVSSIIVVISFVINIGMILVIVFGLWYIIAPNLFANNALRLSGAIVFILLLVKLGWLGYTHFDF